MIEKWVATQNLSELHQLVAIQSGMARKVPMLRAVQFPSNTNVETRIESNQRLGDAIVLFRIGGIERQASFPSW